jgi:hypothetical protein
VCTELGFDVDVTLWNTSLHTGQGVCFEGESEGQCSERVLSETGSQLNYNEVAYVNNPHTCGPPGAIARILFRSSSELK